MIIENPFADGRTKSNQDLHALAQEWTAKFHNALLSEDSFNKLASEATEIIVDTKGLIRIIVATSDYRVEMLVGSIVPGVVALNSQGSIEVIVKQDLHAVIDAMAALWWKTVEERIEKIAKL